jgi:hypothetical protein
MLRHTITHGGDFSGSFNGGTFGGGIDVEMFVRTFAAVHRRSAFAIDVSVRCFLVRAGLYGNRPSPSRSAFDRM